MPKMQQWPRSVAKNQTNSLWLAYDAFMIAQEAARHSPATLEFYRRRLPRFVTFVEKLGRGDPAENTPTDCRLFLVSLERQEPELSDNYIHQFARVVRAFCRFMEADGLVATNPFAKVAMPKQDKRILPAFTP
jgi:site-specific recombinase XerD